MPARPARKRVLTLAETSDTPDARRALLADYCRLIARRVVPAGDAATTLVPALAAAARPSRGRPTAAGPELSPRLSQTLDALLAGDSEKQIALRLSISPHTVHCYVKQLHKRFGVNSRGELLAKFIDR